MTGPDESQIAVVGSVVDEVKVSIGPRFLYLFSEHMYSSPNKAFEELVSNSWDAGAEVVYIGIPPDLKDEQAAIWILDNGESMDVDGFRDLWSVATSNKRRAAVGNGRPQIGKFGIGKLATYLLANELTYVCKATDGVVRAVTMDYRRIDGQAEDSDKLHIGELPLQVREVSDAELRELLEHTTSSTQIMSLLADGVKQPEGGTGWEDEFGQTDELMTPSENTWTLALLSSLKDAGKELQTGWIRWLLRTALPLGSSMALVLNDEVLEPSKIDVGVDEEWVLGESLGITSIELPNGDSRKVTEGDDPFKHVTIEGVPGRVTGRVRLYAGRISGGKSDQYRASNGFHVNILGRVINIEDPYFGIENLNHSAWARFRATVRADGLDKPLAVDREGIHRGEELQVFQLFLKATFNKARTAYSATQRASWPNAGAVLTENWSAVPLEPLRRIIAEGLSSETGLPLFADGSGLEDPDSALKEWKELEARPQDIVTDVSLESGGPEADLVKYDVAARKVIINKDHPFAREHSETHEEQLLLRDAGFADLLTQAYMVDLGISQSQMHEILAYKEQTFRLLAQIRRRTGLQIAELLLESTDNWKALEQILGDALAYLGFVVEPFGQSGEPEGLATAPATPTEKDEKLTYCFTYDAKSSKDGKVPAADVKTAGLVRHRIKHGADHILVVAPDYESGALEEECKNLSITPMRARDLAALLMAAGGFGPFNLAEFRSLFEVHTPDEAHEWVKTAVQGLGARSSLTLSDVLKALEEIGHDGPNATTVSVIADRIAQASDSNQPTRQDVRAVVTGLSVLVPGLLRTTGEEVLLSTSAEKLREAILAQIAKIPAEYQFGMGDLSAAGGDGG